MFLECCAVAGEIGGKRVGVVGLASQSVALVGFLGGASLGAAQRRGLLVASSRPGGCRRGGSRRRRAPRSARAPTRGRGPGGWPPSTPARRGHGRAAPRRGARRGRRRGPRRARAPERSRALRPHLIVRAIRLAPWPAASSGWSWPPSSRCAATAPARAIHSARARRRRAAVRAWRGPSGRCRGDAGAEVAGARVGGVGEGVEVAVPVGAVVSAGGQSAQVSPTGSKVWASRMRPWMTLVRLRAVEGPVGRRRRAGPRPGRGRRSRRGAGRGSGRRRRPRRRAGPGRRGRGRRRRRAGRASGRCVRWRRGGRRRRTARRRCATRPASRRPPGGGGRAVGVVDGVAGVDDRGEDGDGVAVQRVVVGDPRAGSSGPVMVATWAVLASRPRVSPT